MPGYDQISTFLLVLVRCLTFFSLGPVFSSRRVPAQAKLLLALVTAFALFPLVPHASWVLPPTLFGFAMVIAREVLMGALLSFVAGAIFHGIRMAGDLIGVQMGLSMATIIDPQSGETSMIGMVEEMLAVFLFVLLDGHHLFLRGLAFSLERVPPGGMLAVPALAGVVTATALTVFLVMFEVGAPILAALFLTDTALGFVARAVPQINVFVVGIQVKVAVGIFFLLASAPLLARLLSHYTNRLEGQLLALLGGM